MGLRAALHRAFHVEPGTRGAVGISQFLLNTHWESVYQNIWRTRPILRAVPAPTILNKIRAIEIQGEEGEVSLPD